MDTPNYPDILGYITGGTRTRIGVVDAALAVHPRVAHAGSPFNGILLLQNNSDVKVEVLISLSLPAHDALRQPDRFNAKNPTSRIMLRPGEVGYASLPVLCHPDTTASKDYRLKVDVKTTALDKPRLIHQNTDVPVNLDYYFFIPNKSLEKIARLKKLTFAPPRRSSSGTVLEAPFAISSTPATKPTNADSSWVQLWSLAEHTDIRLLYERYREYVVEDVLPVLKYENVRKIVEQITYEQLTDLYPVQPAEVHFIAELMTSLLHMARQPMNPAFPELSLYHVADFAGQITVDATHPWKLPRWVRRLLVLIGADEGVNRMSVPTLIGLLYNDLMRDAIHVGFHLIEHITGEAAGTEDQIELYCDNLLACLSRRDTPLTWFDVYMPLVVGGVAAWDYLSGRSSEQVQYLHQIFMLVGAKKRENRTDDAVPVAFKIVHQALQH